MYNWIAINSVKAGLVFVTRIFSIFLREKNKHVLCKKSSAVILYSCFSLQFWPQHSSQGKTHGGGRSPVSQAFVGEGESATESNRDMCFM